MPWAPPSESSGLSPTHELLRGAGGATRRDLVANLLAFCRVLRTMAPNITASRVIDTCRGLACIDLRNQEDFHTVLQSNLVSSQEDVATFEALYQLFWKPLGVVPDARQLGEERAKPDREIAVDVPLPPDLEEQLSRLLYTSLEEGEAGNRGEADSEALAYSSTEALAQKNFEDFTPSETREMRRVLEQLTPKLATALSRRTSASFRGPSIDLRRSFRQSLRYGGELLTLARKRKKVSKLRIALLCDISGSMDRYSRFLLQFMYGLENKLTGVDAWVFSTRLTEVTPHLRGRSYDECLEQLAQSIHDWSGGTTIGKCLDDFVNGPGKRRISRRSVVVIISDGWDRGEVQRLTRAMQTLKRRAHTIIWLNPLLGNPEYRPLCAGIRAALPYMDYFLPAHNLDSLLKLTKTLNVLGRSL